MNFTLFCFHFLHFHLDMTFSDTESALMNSMAVVLSSSQIVRRMMQGITHVQPSTSLGRQTQQLLCSLLKVLTEAILNVLSMKIFFQAVIS